MHAQSIYTMTGQVQTKHVYTHNTQFRALLTLVEGGQVQTAKFMANHL